MLHKAHVRFIVLNLVLITLLLSACNISRQRIAPIPIAAKQALDEYYNKEYARILDARQMDPASRHDDLASANEVWCVVYKISGPVEGSIVTEGILLIERNETWTVTPWVDHIDDCSIPNPWSPYWSQMF